jgi:uncharacterized membrane protein
MWLDEALSVNIASSPLGDISDRLRYDGHPPLYYWLLHAWMSVFGDSAAAARALSGVLGLVAIVLVWVVARRVGGPRLAVPALALFALSPFAIRYSSEVRMYEMVLVLVLAGWLLLQRAVAAPTIARLVPLTLVSGALLLTHYWSLFLLAALGLGLVVSAWRTGPGEERRALVRITVAVALGGVFFVPWLGVFSYQRAHTGTPWAPASRPTRVVTDSVVDWTGGLAPESGLMSYLFAGLVLLALFARREGNKLVLGRPSLDWRARAFVLVAATMAIGSIAGLAGHSAFAGRYSSVYFPLVVVLFAAGVAVLPNAWARIGVLGAFAVLATAVCWLNVAHYDRTQAGAVAAQIEAAAQPGDVVVACPDQLGPALSRLVDVPGVRVLRLPDLGDPRFVDWVDYQAQWDAVDPVATAERVLAETGDGALWLDWNDGYRVSGPLCGEIAAQLIARRPGSRPVVEADSARYFEFSSLIRLAPPGH